MTFAELCHPAGVCSICQAPLAGRCVTGHPHAAWPVNEGKCCDRCNATIVMLARVNFFKRTEQETAA
jgi:hypothetical protein